MCVFCVFLGRNRSLHLRSSDPARRGPKCSRLGGSCNSPRDLLLQLLILHATVVRQVCAGYVFMPQLPRLLLLYHVEHGIFLRRRRTPGLALRGRAAQAAARLLRVGGLDGLCFLIEWSSISLLLYEMCVFCMSWGHSRSYTCGRQSGPAWARPKKFRARGAPAIFPRAIPCPNI